jgi:hypothetical protein
MDFSYGQGTGLPEGVRPGFGPPDQFNHLGAFPPAEERSVARVNFDTAPAENLIRPVQAACRYSAGA